MNGVLVLSAGNLLLSAAVAVLVYVMSRHFINHGRQQVPFHAERIKRKGKGRVRMPYLYRVHVRFGDAAFYRLVTEEDYQRISRNSNGIVEVYIREFSHVLCSPDWQKYEFSLTETDWVHQDRKRCGGLFIFIFVSWEILILLLSLQ